MRQGWVALGTVLLQTHACAMRVDDHDRDGWSAIDVPPDCDDYDADRFPSHTEVPQDGVDQNCNGADQRMESFGEYFSCELDMDGALSCEGDNRFGQLEVPSTSQPFVQIACGDNHTCALDMLGNVTCWGDNRYGQSTPPLVQGFVRIDPDVNWSLGVRADGPLVCWGLCWEPVVATTAP